ncbi:unnamed protein product [Ceutorhynchus assimilis]|uniref:Uncharacterized protein n=1 Tax=Ceutorhynchus assimilis TaxID=467358 RepID=A0A9N9QIQ7_9CUCU|nr:unnamed protein product [Ceutorhynchus assimilis]
MRKDGGYLIPIKTDAPLDPDSVLKTLFCRYTTGYGTRDNVDSILFNSWYTKKLEKSEADEKLRVVQKAAEIIREDIRAAVYDCSVYPPAEKSSVLCNIPKSLDTLLETIMKLKNLENERHDMKKAAIGQAIISACRPRSFISPILLGIGVYVHREFGSRQIVDFLNNWGFSVTYNETYRYQNCIIKDNVETVASENSLVQYCFDNADFNIENLTGHGTFHSFGGIRLTTPSPPATPKSIARQIDIVSSTATAEKDDISISWYKAPKTLPLKNVIVRDIKIDNTEMKNLMKCAKTLDLLWLSSNWAGVDKPPSWGGAMKLALSGYVECEKTSVTILPFINMSPTDPSTIYSALKFALKETRQLGQEHCIVTFDQQLYDKVIDPQVLIAMEEEELRKIFPSYGDRIAILEFCNRYQNTKSRKQTLLERLRQKMSSRKKRNASSSSEDEENDLDKKTKIPKNTKMQETRFVEIGWFLSTKEDEVPKQPPSTTVTVHRGHIFEEILEIFDSKSITGDVKVQIVLSNGELEAAADIGGVWKDALSEFWATMSEKCTGGTNILVPQLRHDFGCKKWRAIARVLKKGWSSVGYFPVKLSKIFMENSIFKRSYTSVEQEFLQYINGEDRYVLEEALKNFQTVEKDELIDILARFDCKSLVTEANFKVILDEIANKEIIQKPAFVANCFYEELRNFMSLEELATEYKTRQPTARNTLKLIKFENASNPNREKVSELLQKFIRESDERLRKSFLRFCTGADKPLGDDIKI